MNIEDTVFTNSLPVNSLAVLHRLATVLRENNTNSLASPYCKGDDRVERLLWLLSVQYYGQLTTVDPVKVYEKLYRNEQQREENRLQSIKEHTHVGGE